MRLRFKNPCLAPLAFLMLAACSQPVIESPPVSAPSADGGEGVTETRDGDGSSVVWDIETFSAPIDGAEDAVIPEGQDPSLAEDALAAAFALVRQQRGIAEVLDEQPLPSAVPPEKKADVFRIALMLPQRGAAGRVSRDIQGGAELAMFTLAPRHVDMVFIDTSDNLNTAIIQARSSEADVILGPLFSGDTAEVRQLLRDDPVSVISFSNDVDVASPGVFQLGQSPEQEIGIALSHALETTTPISGSGRGSNAVAILSDDSPYGLRVANEAEQILFGRGMDAATRVVFGKETLDDEESLRNAVQSLARWVPSSESGTRTPPYDIVVLAGEISFSLRVAPVLAWYDLDPERIRFVGTSLWSAPSILQEPSLQHAIYADAPSSRRQTFNRLWRDTGTPTPGDYARLGFDAVALTSTLSASDPESFQSKLTNREGFAGFSGTFRFEVDGRNTRLLDVVEIDGGSPKVVAAAGTAFGTR